MRHKIKGSWDAHAYDQISYSVQYRWGQQVIELRSWHGNEIVMDAATNMLEQARTNLRCFDNVEIVQSSFTDVKLARKVDVIFSNSAFHWIQDHRKAFQSFWGMLKPTRIHKLDDGNYPRRINRGGQLLIQCGAYGNLQYIIMVLERIAHSHQFKAYFTDWKQPWHFAKPDETDKLLEEVGYVNRNVHSTNDSVVFPNRNVYAKFMKTVIMKSYLEHLSINTNSNNYEKLKGLFFDMFLNEIKKYSNKPDEQWRLDFQIEYCCLHALAPPFLCNRVS